MTKDELLERAKPILFNTDMVRAIQGGNKSATRRIVKPQPANKNDIIYQHPECGKWFISPDNDSEPEIEIKPRYKVDDILYVRETWMPLYDIKTETKIIGYSYKAESAAGIVSRTPPDLECAIDGNWKPSIHMPKEAARIFLHVTGVRVERLQDIITGDYKTPLNINKEGVIMSCSFCTHHNGECKDFISQHSPKNLTCKLLEDFTLLWDSTVKKSDLIKYGWNTNPWVFVIEFERVEVPE